MLRSVLVPAGSVKYSGRLWGQLDRSGRDRYVSAMARRAFWQRLPSIGFVCLLLVYAGLVVFLAWGFTKPPLERVWELHHELKIGKVALLSAEDRQLVQAALERHPALADALLSDGKLGVISAHEGGWLEAPRATLIRAPDAPSGCQLRIEISGKAPKSALSATLEGSGWRREVRLDKQRATTLTLPAGKGRGEVLSFEVAPAAPQKDLRVKVDPRCPPSAQPE